MYIYKLGLHRITKHVQYCQSDTGRESTSRPDKLLQTVNMLYGPGVGWSRDSN